MEAAGRRMERANVERDARYMDLRTPRNASRMIFCMRRGSFATDRFGRVHLAGLN